MTSITLSVPPEVKKQMETFVEVNWSGFIRQAILRKTEQLALKERLTKKAETESDIVAWSVALQHKARKGRVTELRRQARL